MTALQPTSGISFNVETLIINNGRRLGAIRPSNEGYYTMPLAVLGIATRNNTYYDVPDFTDQITSSESTMNKLLVDGNLFGEYGHPDISLLDNDKAIARLLVIDEKHISHHFKRIWSGPKLESGGVIIYGEIKPFGPYKESLSNSLDDPNINTAFSLRSIASSQMKNGIIWRNIKKLVTFDTVAAGGYKEASKRFSPSNESIAIPITPGITRLSEAAVENFTNHELNEIFGAKNVMIMSQSFTHLPDSKSIISDKGELRSIYHELIKE